MGILHIYFANQREVLFEKSYKSQFQFDNPWQLWSFMKRLLYNITVLSQFVINVAFCNKTVAFCNKKSDAFCNKILSHFVIN